MPKITALAPFMLLSLVLALTQVRRWLRYPAAKRKICVKHKWMTFDEYRKRYKANR